MDRRPPNKSPAGTGRAKAVTTAARGSLSAPTTKTQGASCAIPHDARGSPRSLFRSERTLCDRLYRRAGGSRSFPLPVHSVHGSLGSPPRRRLRPARWRRPPRALTRPPLLAWRRWSWEGWYSTLIAGCGWPRAAVSALAPRLRFDGCSAGWRRRDGGSVTHSSGVGAGISTASRSRRTASRMRSRPNRARSPHTTWPAPGTRPRGFTGVGGGGVGEERSRCCAWCAPAGWRRSRLGFSWCRWTAWCPRSEPAPERHLGRGSWRRRPRRLSPILAHSRFLAASRRGESRRPRQTRTQLGGARDSR